MQEARAWAWILGVLAQEPDAQVAWLDWRAHLGATKPCEHSLEPTKRYEWADCTFQWDVRTVQTRVLWDTSARNFKGTGVEDDKERAAGGHDRTRDGAGRQWRVRVDSDATAWDNLQSGRRSGLEWARVDRTSFGVFCHRQNDWSCWPGGDSHCTDGGWSERCQLGTVLLNQEMQRAASPGACRGTSMLCKDW